MRFESLPRSRFAWASIASVLAMVLALLGSDRIYASTTDLCSADLEGSFVARMDGKRDVRINLICVDSDRLVGTMAHLAGSGDTAFILNIGWAEIDGDDLIVASFHKNPSEHRAMGAPNPFHYMRLDLSALREHRIEGSFVGFRGEAFHPLRGKRVQTFPRPVSKLRGSPLTSPRGIYEIVDAPLAPARLLFDVIHGIPIGTISFRDNGPIHLTNGPEWSAATATFNLNNIGGDMGEPGSVKLFNARGSFVSERELEFSLITPTAGLSAVYHARLVASDRER